MNVGLKVGIFPLARKRTTPVWAEQSPFELKDELKRRGYR